MRIEPVQLSTFVLAMRDSGYKSLAHAVAEIVDNSLDAQASTITIKLLADTNGKTILLIADDGHGMSRQTLGRALSFGWSSKFGNRGGLGRYGMGLPNSCLSHARRVDVYSWQNSGSILHTYFDIDDVLVKGKTNLPSVQPGNIPGPFQPIPTKSGTLIVWSNCDRLQSPTPRLLMHLKQTLGRIFRYFLWNGKRIIINDGPVLPIDPLMIRDCPLEPGAAVYGEKLTYSVDPDLSLDKKTRSTVEVSFSLLPVKEWHSLPNEEKRRLGITRGGGVSIVRAGREIDFGWFFMGSKRKENYDDWWRCEIRYSPDLDELFGLTHTKQDVNPSIIMNKILIPDMSAIARSLNREVRTIHESLKNNVISASRAIHEAERFLTPLHSIFESSINQQMEDLIKIDSIYDPAFYVPHRFSKYGGTIINSNHGFYSRFYRVLEEFDQVSSRQVLKMVQLLLLSIARVELSQPKQKRNHYEEMRKQWGNLLEAYLRENR